MERGDVRVEATLRPRWRSSEQGQSCSTERKSVTKRSQKTDEQATIGHYGTHKHMSSVESPEAAYREGGHSPVWGQGDPSAKVVTTH